MTSAPLLLSSSSSSGNSVISSTAGVGLSASSASVGHLGLSTMVGMGAVRVASTVVTNVVRPVISTPVPIASKPRDLGPAPSPLHDRRSMTPHLQPPPPPPQQPQLLIGSGAGSGATVSGYYSSSSSSSPHTVGAAAAVAAAAVGPGGVMTNLVLGGAFSAAQPTVQLISPPQQHQQASPPQQQAPPTAGHLSAPHGPANNGALPLSLLQPHLLSASSLTSPPGGKAVTQVQYILPTLPVNAKSSPQPHVGQPAGVFNLPTAPPTHVSLANGKQQHGAGALAGYATGQGVGVGVGVGVSSGARGERPFITRLFSMLWNAPFTCTGLPDFRW